MTQTLDAHIAYTRHAYKTGKRGGGGAQTRHTQAHSRPSSRESERALWFWGAPKPRVKRGDFVTCLMSLLVGDDMTHHLACVVTYRNHVTGEERG